MKYLLPFVVLAVSVFFILYIPRLIYVDKISCKSQFGPCSTSLNDRLGSLSGRNLKEVKKGAGEVLSIEPSISDFSMQLRIPNTLNVVVLEKKPKFALNSGEYYALIEKEGVVLRIESATSLPYIETNEKLPGVGETVGEKTFFGLNIIYNLFIQYQVKSGVLKGNSLVIDSIQGKRVVFPLEGDVDVLLGSLRLIINRLNASGKDTRIESSVKEIDLRYKNPVLR